jgi:hypothetical protein
MQNGQRLAAPEPLETIRRRAQRELARLPAPLARLASGYVYPVSVAPALQALAAAVDRRTATMEGITTG